MFSPQHRRNETRKEESGHPAVDDRFFSFPLSDLEHTYKFLSACHTQVPRRLGDHATDISGHTDHLETLPHACGSSFSVATKNTEGDAMLPRSRFNTFQGIHKFGFSPVATRC